MYRSGAKKMRGPTCEQLAYYVDALLDPDVPRIPPRVHGCCPTTAGRG
jgi:hypothetical protein